MLTDRIDIGDNLNVRGDTTGAGVVRIEVWFDRHRAERMWLSVAEAAALAAALRSTVTAVQAQVDGQ